MIEWIRTSVLAGLGAGVITKEKAEEVTNRLVEQGKLTADEGRQLVSDLLKSGGRQWDDFQAGLREAVRKSLESANVARAQDLKEITQRLEKIEQRISMFEDAIEQIRSSTADPSDNNA
ncbi:MAG: phasin family protein [Planctomycetota bacterium]